MMKKGTWQRFLAAGMMITLVSACGVSETPQQGQASGIAADAGETAKKAEDKPSEKPAEEPESAADPASTAAEKPDADTGKSATEEKTTAQENAADPLWYDAAAAEVPANEALDFTAGMGAGFNLGNTFDAYNDTGIKADLSNELTTETYWQPVQTTEQTIRGIADAGFQSIRIPVSWHNHVTGDVEISPAFLDRVKTVVDWALDAGLKVILNIHHDNHPEANGIYPDQAHRDQSLHYVTRIWQQVAECFADYDDRLIFESMNEPRLVGEECEWWFNINNPPQEILEAVAVINELNQAFVDTVRSTQGRHRNCYLMCPGYDASPDGALVKGFQLPQDAADIDNRIIVAVHAYTPYDFALNESGTASFDPANSSDRRDIDHFIGNLYDTYIKNGIPVIIGEFGARDKNGNTQDRIDFLRYYTATAWAHGIPCMVWDNGAFSGSGEIFGIYDRAKGELAYPEIGRAIITNAVRR